MGMPLRARIIKPLNAPAQSQPAVGCGTTPSQKLTALSEEFVYGSLAYSPSAATAAGLHQYQKQNLDEMLDDFGEQNLDRQRTFFEKFRDRLGEIQTGD